MKYVKIESTDKIGTVPPIGSIVKARGIAASDITEYFGAKFIQGLYIGDNRVYLNKKVYPVDMRSIQVIKKPTKATIKKAKETANKLVVKRKAQKELIEKQIEERDKNTKFIIDILKSCGFKKGKTKNCFVIIVDVKKPPKRFRELYKELMRYYDIKTYREYTLLDRKKSRPFYPGIRIRNEELKSGKLKVFYYIGGS